MKHERPDPIVLACDPIVLANDSVAGVSAIKAIGIAESKGQKIYHVSASNLLESLRSLDLPENVERDIADAVNAGLEVTTHASPVDFFGDRVAGYAIIDPKTGSGAYRLSGGENGSYNSSNRKEEVLVAGISFEAIKTALNGIVSGVTAIFNFEKCGPGIAITLLILSLAMAIFSIWLTAILGAVFIVRMAFSIRLFVDSCNTYGSISSPPQ